MGQFRAARKHTLAGKRVCMLLAIILLGSIFLDSMSATVEAQASVSDLVDIVKKNVGSAYPFTEKDAKTSSRMIFGIMANRLSSYAAYEKISGSGNNTAEYFLFIGKASSKANAKKNAASLERYVSRESSSMQNYLSAEGKKLFQKAQTGYKGCWCWMVMVNSSGNMNKKAVKAMKKQM